MDDADASAIRQLLIDEVDIVLVSQDALEAHPRGRCDIDVWLEGGVGKRHLDQRTRLGVVVNQQDPDLVDLWKLLVDPPLGHRVNAAHVSHQTRSTTPEVAPSSATASFL